MSPIHFFIPTSNLVVEKSQITLKLASKNVEKVVFQEMKKSFQFGKVNELVFIFSVTSKVRIYEKLKNVFQEAKGNQFSQVKYCKKSDLVESCLQHSLSLTSKNVKNAFFECITRNQSKSGVTFVTFTFTLLSTDPIYAELEDNSPKESKESEKNKPLSIPWTTHPSGRAISNPLYGLASQSKSEATFVTFTLLSTDPIYAELEDNFPKESKESEKNHPPPIPWATHPSRRAVSNPLYGLAPQLAKEKNLLKRIIGSLKKCFAKKSFPIPQARYTLQAFACDTGSKNFEKPLHISCKEPIYAEIDSSKKRNLSKDSGYESPRESIRSTCSDSDFGYEIPHQVEPAIYLEVLP